MTLPAGLFDRLVNLTTLNLSQNDLSSLPANLFEPLVNLTHLNLDGNPGSGRGHRKVCAQNYGKACSPTGRCHGVLPQRIVSVRKHGHRPGWPPLDQETVFVA